MSENKLFSKEIKAQRKQLEKAKKAELKVRRKAFVKNIDKLFQTEYEYSKNFEKTHLFNDGKAYINVDLTKVDSPFSIYSYETRIDQEIYDYIENEANYLRADVPLVINFDDDGKYSGDLKAKIAKAVSRHYSLKYEEKRKELKKTTFSAWIIFIIGLMITAFSLTMGFLQENESVKEVANVYSVIKEVVIIAGWMFVWESGDRFFFSGSRNREDVFNAGQLALVEIRFGKPIIPIVKK